MRVICFALGLVLFLHSIILFAQNDDSVLCIHNSIEAVKTINQILAKISESSYVGDEQTMGSIDSICNAKKTVRDYFEESTVLSTQKKFYLGNSLIYKTHFLDNFKVAYVMYTPFVLVKIKFRYSFHFNGKEKIDTSIRDLLKGMCNLNLEFGKGDYGVEYFEAEMTRDKGIREVKNRFPYINFDINSENLSKETKKIVNYVNDPANQLTYGFACSIGGDPPDGYAIFADLFHYKHFNVIEKLLYSPNPVTRLYACDALEHAYKKNLYVLPLKISDRINEIKNEETKIECCWGCLYEMMSIKEAVKEAEIPKKYLYHNFIFPDDNEE